MMFDKERANLCTKRMNLYFQEFPLSTVEVPSTIKSLSIEHLYYLFYSCLLDYGMRSTIYHSHLCNTYSLFPNIFQPHFVAKQLISEEDLLDILKTHVHPRYPNIAVKKWIKLSEFLSSFSKEELIEKIQFFQTYNDLSFFIKQSNCYGQKTGGLLIRLLYDSGICHTRDEIQDIPIDRHDIEISFLNGVIAKSKLNQEEIKHLSSIWIEAAKKWDVSPSAIDKYLWNIGEQLCAKRKCSCCPLQTTCIKKSVED